MKSLRDQLLTAGLADAKAVKSLHEKKRKKNKKPKNARAQASEITRQVEQAQHAKASRDKELNRLRQLEAEKKARLAQIQQLIDTSKIDRTEGEVAYHFTRDGKIKSIYVTVDQQQQLARNQIAIAISAAGQVELVPGAVAEKIAERDASRILDNKTDAPSASAEDDPYASYQVPDDLIW